jgi:hypothetical protein
MEDLKHGSKIERNRQYAAFKRCMTSQNPSKQPSPEILAIWNQASSVDSSVRCRSESLSHQGSNGCCLPPDVNVAPPNPTATAAGTKPQTFSSTLHMSAS